MRSEKRVVCPTCKGRGVQDVALTTHGEGAEHKYRIVCVFCAGRGTLSQRDAAEFARWRNSFCKCSRPASHAYFVPDHADPSCEKHHWRCSHCNGLVQIG